MTKKRFVYIRTAIVLLALVLAGCRQTECTDCIQSQGLSHMSGPMDITAAATESAPGLYFAGDSDTGIYSAAANQLGFSTGGTERFNLSSSGLGFTGGFAATLGAAELVLIDGDTTNQTQTAGVVDINVGSVTADVSGLNIAATQDDGTVAATDMYAGVVTLTQNDADGDMRGIKITAAATTNAAAASYEYGLTYDCAENTAAACTDGILLTATTDTGLTDAIDASDAEIVNAVNIGVNPILGSNADTLFLGLTDHHLTLTGNEAATVTFFGADNAGAADTALDTTGAGTVYVGSADVLAVTLLADNDVQIHGGATGNVSLDLRDYADSTSDDMAHASFIANCSNTGAGTEECDLAVATVRAGVESTAINIDADAEMTLLSETEFELQNAASGNVTLIFQDYADTATDDLDHVVLTANCTDATATEDCDFTIGVVENATAAETRFHIDADLGIIVGSANTNLVTLQTDDTGDGTDLVLPAQGVNAAEILNDTITFAQIADTTAVDADTNITLADGIELSLTASHTTGDTEALLIDIDQVDDGNATDDIYALKIDATSESGDAGDLFYGMGIVWEQGTANTIMDAAISIDNEDTTASTMTDAIIVTSSGVNLGVTDGLDVSAASILYGVNTGVNPILGGNADMCTIGATDAAFIFTRNDTGAVTFAGADDASPADTIYDTTGAGVVTVGSGDVTDVAITTDGTGDAELVVPENSIGPDEGAFMTDILYFCGQQANNGTIYFAPVLAFLTGDFSAAYVMGDAQCDALDNATEATIDEPIGYANTSFKVLGMMCEASSTGSNGVAFTLRSAAADLTPSMTCTVATGATSCTSVTSSTTDVAAGATLAMQVVNTEDLSLQDGWCKVYIALK